MVASRASRAILSAMKEFKRTRVLVMSSDKNVRDVLRWAVGEIADEVQVASTWTLALQLAGVHHPRVAVLDFDRVSPQGRVLLANLLRLRYQTAIVVVGVDASLDD